MKDNLKKLGVVVLGTSALMGASQQAFAKINIQSVSTYSTVLNEDKFKNLGDFQAENEERFAVLYDVVRNFANGTYSASDVNNNLTPTDVMRDGDTLSVFSTKGSVVGSTVSTEPIVRIGSGSNIKVDAQGFLDVENSENVTIAGKTYNFAGGETSGIVSVGDLAGRSGGETRKVSGVSAATLSGTSLEAVNGSQLYATNQAIDGLKTVVDGNTRNITNLTNRVNQGWTASAETGTANNVQMGETLKFVGDTRNIGTSIDGSGNVKVELKPNVTATSFTAGNVSMSTTGINAGNNKVVNMADGAVNATSKEGINGSQLFNALQNIPTTTSNFAVTDGTNTITKQSGQSIAFKPKDANVTVGVENGEMKIGLGRNITADSFRAGDVFVSTTGINAGNKKIQGVADGLVNATSKEAVNGSQLFTSNIQAFNRSRDPISTKTDNGNFNLHLGEKFNVLGDDNITTSGTKVTCTATSSEVPGATVYCGESTLNVKLKPNVTADSFTAGDVSINKTTGINAGNKKIVGVADGAVNATSKEGVNGSQLFATNQNVTNLTNKVNQGWTASAETGTPNNIQMNETLKFVGDTRNIGTSIDGSGNVKVELKPNVTATSFTAGNVSMSTTGINAGGNKVVNMADGTVSETSKEGINGSQLFKALQNIPTTTSNFAVTDGVNTITKQSGQSIAFKPKDNNVTVGVENGEMKIGLNTDLTVNSVRTGDVFVSTTGINGGSKKIVNVADGLVNPTSKEVVNGSQLYSVHQAALNPIRTSADTGSFELNLNEQLVVNGDSNITTSAEPFDRTCPVRNGTVGSQCTVNQLNIKLNPDISANSFTAGDIVINKTTGINAGNKKITNLAKGDVSATSTDAVNGSQLFDAIQNIDVGNVVKYDGNTQNTVTLQGGTTGTTITNLKAGAVNATSKDAVNGSQLYATNQNVTNLTNKVNQGFGVSDGTNKINKQLGDVVVFKAKDTNVTVGVENGEMKVGLNPNLSVNSVKTGDVGISTTGVNAGNKTVVNVGKGAVNATSTDAVNGSQLFETNQLINNVDNKVNAGWLAVAENGGALSVNPTDNKLAVFGDDENITTHSAIESYTDDFITKNRNTLRVKLNRDVNLDSATFGGVVINKTTGINAGDKKITNLAKGDVSATSTDAVNGSQLYGLQTNFNQKFENVVLYDNADKTSVTLGGTGGTRVTNVQAGMLSNFSTDAVNGSQLYDVILDVNDNRIGITNNTLKIDANRTAIQKNAADIAKGLSFADTANNTVNKKLGETMAFVNTDGNVNVALKEGKMTIDLAKDLNTNSVTTKTLTVGDVVINADGINAGNTTINNVNDGLIAEGSKQAVNGGQIYNLKTQINQELGNFVKYDGADKTSVTLGGTGGTTIKNVKAGAVNATSTEAVNGGQLYATNQKVEGNTRNITNLTNKVNEGLNFTDGKTTMNKKLGDVVEISSGDDNVAVELKEGKYKVSLNKEIKVGGTTINNNGINNGGNKINNVAKGDVSANSTDVVNGSQLFETNQLINNVDNKVNGLTDKVNQGWNAEADSGDKLNIQMGDTFGIKGDGNITTHGEGKNVNVKLAKDLSLNSVQTGNVSISADGINAGNRTINNVGDAVKGTDAVNLNQLNKGLNSVNNRINDLEDDMKAGVAQAMATASLGQAYDPGMNTVSVGAATYRGKVGFAIGGTNISDNGKWMLKYSVSGSGKKNYGAAGSVTYQFH